MLDSVRLMLHAFVVLPAPSFHPHPKGKMGLPPSFIATQEHPTSPALYAGKDGLVVEQSTSVELSDHASKLRALFAATTIFVAAATSVQVPDANAVTGKVIEGPSNAEMLEVTLQPGDKILADTGTLLYMTDGVSFDSEFRGDALKRFVQGGRLVANVFTNGEENHLPNNAATVALAPAFPSRILPVQLEDYGNTIIGNVHSFLAAPYNVELDYERTSLDGPKLFNLLRMERVTGKGTVYLTGSGNIFAKQLKSGEKLKLYPGAWVAMTDHMKMDFVKGRSRFFSGSLLEVEGPGTIWIDTAPITRIVNEIDDRLPKRSS